GQDANQIEAIWQRLFWATHGTAVGAITSLALAAVDIALWDVRGKTLGQPLWRLAGGARPTVPLYDTEGGWLHLSAKDLVAGAAGILQPDAARLGGITPWLKVAHLAEAFNVKVAPHFLMELHVSLAAAVPNAIYLEHIPQLRQITRSEIEIVNGQAVAPESP